MNSRKRKAPADEVALGGDTALNTGASSSSNSKYPLTLDNASPLAVDNYFQNLYASEPNFKQLARQDAAFASFIKEDGKLDFTDPAAMMQLTKTLLMADFGLRLEMPDDRLCPPVTNRHNYILWLKGLMDTTSYGPPGRKICGIDVGTGASCIYPLLGATQRPLHFVATDIDPKSLEYARRNVRLNGLEDRIQILERTVTSALIPLSDLEVESVDFVMMNPPFYSSEDEMLSSAKGKGHPPHSACTGAPVEMVCEGGEVAYIGRMMDESLVFRDRVQWYTAMVGKASSIEALVDRLRENRIDNFAVTEFIQGNKTRRWALGWSFGPMRPSDSVARGIKTAAWKNVLPPPLQVVLLSMPAGKEVSPLVTRITEVVDVLELISWDWDAETAKGVGRASENVWGRAWRRKQLREAKQGPALAGSTEKSDECQIGFAISVEVGKDETVASLRWVEGHNHSIFESLCGFLQGKLQGIKDSSN
ncbi:hypothetical protein B0T16DRAFT_420787 [Cercophora newfieldiana]|uniref:U6 small nuclear RNA (adenine-(43)-N(6))-methyltransferase n=1 Tax=Cercophora newfieldiana TaxID=92897 RepID=A0AA39XX92_9PEZI|nr:hypothetical protein B0T16DRAFT_420787 [Cercophora newfieldiana]